MTTQTPLSKCRTLLKQLEDYLPNSFNTEYDRDIIRTISFSSDKEQKLNDLGHKSFDEVSFEFELQVSGSERNYVNVNMLYFNKDTGNYEHEIVAFYSIDKCLDENFETTLTIIKTLATIEQKRVNQ